MKKDQVLDFMDSLEKDDGKLGSYVKMYEALSSFLTDFDFLKDSLGLTQQDVAERMGTTQSAISRIASLKTNPSYKQLLKMAEAVGGELLVTPMKDMTVQVPYDLQESVRKMAAGEGMATSDYLERMLRNAIELERACYMNRTLVLNKVSEPRAVYDAPVKKRHGVDEESVALESTDWCKKMSVEMTPGKAIRADRGLRGWTQNVLAQKLGVSIQNLSAMEHDRRPVSKKMAAKLSQVFGVPPETYFKF